MSSMTSHLRFVGTVVIISVGLVLHGCGGGGPSPPEPGPTPPPSYDGNPPFMLEDVGIKAFSYNPLYLNDPICLLNPGTRPCTHIINDDVSAEWAQQMWSSDGRADIKTMSTFGANSVRLYGNDPRFSKRRFFDELLRYNMKAIAGLSDYLYVNPNTPLGCIHAEYNCFENVTETYYAILTTGEFAKNGYYHNAVEVVSLMNEPDISLWLPGQWDGPANYIKAMITAFDGVLSAEKKAGIGAWKNRKLPKFTIGWSYALLRPGLCSQRGYIQDPKIECGPGLGFASQFYNAVQDPKSTVGYEPLNDLAAAYRTRWLNSIQPFVPAKQLLRQVVQPAALLPAMQGSKLYLGEYNPAVDMCVDRPSCEGYGREELERDLATILRNETFTRVILGASFFEFQQAYNKYQTHELAYGMFNLTADAPWKTGYIKGDNERSHPINCLDWKTPDLCRAVADVFGGSVPELFCPSNRTKGSQWDLIV